MLLCYAYDLVLVIPKHHHQVTVPQALELLLQHFSFLGLKITPGKSRYTAFSFSRNRSDWVTPLFSTLPHTSTWGSGLIPPCPSGYMWNTFKSGLQWGWRCFTDCLSGRRTSASVEVKRRFYTAAVRSVLDYSALCLPELSNTSYQSLEVVQNGAMRAILGAPRWTYMVTLRAGFKNNSS